MKELVYGPCQRAAAEYHRTHPGTLYCEGAARTPNRTAVVHAWTRDPDRTVHECSWEDRLPIERRRRGRTQCRRASRLTLPQPAEMVVRRMKSPVAEKGCGIRHALEPGSCWFMTSVGSDSAVKRLGRVTLPLALPELTASVVTANRPT
jgi:hypothetical protein